MASRDPSSDPFDDVLNLEERFYSEGYKQGVADGDRAGRVEGRSFGIEKGFEKFAEAGRLHGKAVVWANRLAPSPPRSLQTTGDATMATFAEGETRIDKKLPGLHNGGARLEKNVVTLHALVEPETLSTENTDEAVNDFDDRVKRAQGKARVIERQIGEDASSSAAARKEAAGSRAVEVKSGGGSQGASSSVTTTTTTTPPPPAEADTGF